MNLFDQHTAYSLSDFCTMIRSSIEEQLPSTYTIRAEISSLAERGGHAYFELVEKAPTKPNQQGAIFKAKMRATCWANTYAMLRAYFEQEAGEPLRVGMQVELEVSVEMHPIYGLSLNIHGINPSFTLGDIALQRQQTLFRLQAAGVMEMNKELPFPTLPQRIAVISSSEAAGYGDFINQLHNNPYHFAFQVELFSALVQGDRAAQSIMEALDRVAERLHEFQVVVILRGGGATTDLACFDDYHLAETCAQFPLPIIAGIGHQRDVSVVDMIAHSSVKTPTAAAELLIDKMLQAAQRVEQYKQRLLQTIDHRVLIARHRLEKAQTRAYMAFAHYLQQQKQHLLLVEKHIALRSPEKIFQMGYSLTRVNGKLIRHVDEAPKGTRVETVLQDGSFTAIVE